MPNYKPHGRNKHASSSFMRRLRRSIQFSASSLSFEQDHFLALSRHKRQATTRTNINDQHEQNERIVRITALPLHQDTTAIPATTMVQNLPLTLGRKTLATWWWDACCDCSSNNSSESLQKHQGPPSKRKRRHFCVRRCLPLAEEVASLSKAMMTISKEGVLDLYPGKHAAALIHVQDRSVIAEKEQQRLFDLSIGRESEKPWMKFRFELPGKSPQQKTRWLTCKDGKSVTPSPATKKTNTFIAYTSKGIGEEDGASNTDKVDVLEPPSSPLSVFSPVFCFPATEAARKLRWSKPPTQKSHPKALLFSSQESAQPTNKRKHGECDTGVFADGDFRSSPPSTPRKRKRLIADDCGIDFADEENVRQEEEQKDDAFVIHHKGGDVTTKTKKTTLKNSPKRKLKFPTLQKKSEYHDENCDGRSGSSSSDPRHQIQIIPAKRNGNTQVFSALSDDDDDADSANDNCDDDDGDEFHGEGQNDAFVMDTTVQSNGTTGLDTGTQGTNPQISFPSLHDNAPPTTQQDRMHSQPPEPVLGIPEVRKEGQDHSDDLETLNSYPRYTQQRTQINAPTPTRETNLYCQQDSQPEAFSSSSYDKQYIAAETESHRVDSPTAETNTPALQPSPQSRLGLPSISFHRLNLSMQEEKSTQKSPRLAEPATSIDRQLSQPQSQLGDVAMATDHTNTDSSAGRLMIASQAQPLLVLRESYSVLDEVGDDRVQHQSWGKTEMFGETLSRPLLQQPDEENVKERGAAVGSSQSAFCSSQESSVLDLPVCDHRFSTQSSLLVHDNHLRNYAAATGVAPLDEQRETRTTSAGPPTSPTNRLEYWKMLQQQKTGLPKSSRALIDLIVEKNQGNHDGASGKSFWLPSILNDCCFNPKTTSTSSS